MGLFWKKKQEEKDIDAEINDLDTDLSSNVPLPPPAPGFFKKKLEQHPEDLFESVPGEEKETSMQSLPDIEEEPFQDEELDKLFEETPLPEEAQRDEIKKAVEEVKTRPEPEFKPTRIFLRPETITMEDIEREFEDPVIEQPRSEDFGFVPKPKPEPKPAFKPAQAPRPEPPRIIIPEKKELKLPEIEEDELPDFDSVFGKTPGKPFTIYAHPKVEGELFIRLDDYSKISPKIKELQTTLNSAVRTLNAEVNIESTQLSALGTLNNTLDQIQEKLMEIDGLVFKEED